MSESTRPQRKKAAPAAEKPVRQTPAAEPTMVETSADIAAVVAKSLRDGGMKASDTEVLVAIGDTAIVVDRGALDKLAVELGAAENPSTWFASNRAAIRNVVFVPAQPRVLRATPLLSVRPQSPAGITHGWVIPNHMPGVHAVVGGTGAGKSVALSKMELDVVIRWGEPTEMYDFEEHTIPVADFTEMLAVALMLARGGYRVAVDSLRPLVFGLTGAAGAGGVSVALFGALTSINNLFSELGLLVVVAVNPMSTEDKAKLVFENIAASVAGMTVVENGKVSSQTARTSRGRISSNPGNGSSDFTVDTYVPRQTKLGEPGGASVRVRLETTATEVDTDTDNEPGRRGAKLSI